MESKRYSAWGDLLVLAACFLGSMLVLGVCTAVVMAITGKFDWLRSEPSMFIVYTAQFTLAVVAGIVWLRRRSGVRLRFSVQWFDAPLVLGGIILVTAAGIVMEPLMNLFPERYFDQLAEMIGRGGWAILMTVVAAPLLEEIFFRGLLLETLSRKWSATAAVAASALLFGAAHAPNLPQMVNAVVIAIVMGYIYLTARSLVPVIIIHAINNGLAYMMLEFTGSQNTDTREMIGGDPLYWTLYAISAAVLALFLIFMVRKVRTKKSENTLQTKTADE